MEDVESRELIHSNLNLGQGIAQRCRSCFGCVERKDGLEYSFEESVSGIRRANHPYRRDRHRLGRVDVNKLAFSLPRSLKLPSYLLVDGIFLRLECGWVYWLAELFEDLWVVSDLVSS